MTLKVFIAKNRKQIDWFINRTIYRHDGNGHNGIIPTPAPTYNDHERQQWILNDEGLYDYARSEGCKI